MHFASLFLSVQHLSKISIVFISAVNLGGFLDVLSDLLILHLTPVLSLGFILFSEGNQNMFSKTIKMK